MPADVATALMSWRDPLVVNIALGVQNACDYRFGRAAKVVGTK